MDNKNSEGQIDNIERKIDTLVKNTAGRRFIIVVVAVVSGIFTILGVAFEAVIAPRTEHAVQMARITGSEAAKFYVNVASQISDLNDLVDDFCDFGVFAKERSINDAIEGTWKALSRPPPTIDQEILRLASEYNHYVARYVGELELRANQNQAKDDYCQESRKLLEMLTSAMDKEIIGFAI